MTASGQVMITEEELASATTEAHVIKSTAALRKVDPLLLFEVLRHRRQAETITAITEGLDTPAAAIRDRK